MKKPILFAAAAALALAACATTPMGTPVAGDMTPEERGAYVQMAASSDLYEIQSSNLALQRAQNPAVRQFAQMLITHHTQTSQQLMAAARASGMSPTPQLLPMHAQMIAQLQQASGAGFDDRFTDQQVPAHEMALALHSNYARDGDTPALRATAAAAVPIVSQHLAQARQLDR